MYIAINNINYNKIEHSNNIINSTNVAFNVKANGSLYYGEKQVKVREWFCDSCTTCFSCHNCQDTHDGKKPGCTGCNNRCNDCNGCNSCNACNSSHDKTNTCSEKVSTECANCYSGAQANAKETLQCKQCLTCQLGQASNKGTNAGAPSINEKCTYCYGSCYDCYNIDYAHYNKQGCAGCISDVGSNNGTLNDYGTCTGGCYGACVGGCFSCYGGCNSCNACNSCLTCNGCTHCVSAFSGCASGVDYSRPSCVSVDMDYSGCGSIIGYGYTYGGVILHSNCTACVKNCYSCRDCQGCPSCPSCTGSVG